MAKKKIPPSAPSKAYLVSFGDTMTALLAFFIVINSLAQEQTGANLYSGTGSFVNAVDGIGFAGAAPTEQSKYIESRESPMPLYALAENLYRNESPHGNIGPDETNDDTRKMDYDNETYQRFLTEMERQFKLLENEPLVDQVVFDSFEGFKKRDPNNVLSDHAIQLAAEIMPSLRDSRKTLDVVIWATMPSPVIINQTLKTAESVRNEIKSKFMFAVGAESRITFSVKPWLFSDAKRPVISFVVGQKSRKSDHSAN